MDALGSGLITLANGFYTVTQRIVSPTSAAVLIIVLGTAIMGAARLEELDRKSAKPQIGRH
ncbi:MAG: hypothetical protein WC184_11220 [Acidimicrobiia bacterium]